MKKVVLKLALHDDKEKRKAMKTVSRTPAIDSISMDMKEGKLTIVGDVDPVVVVKKLRKAGWHAEILTVGPAKEEKKDQGKKDEKKKTPEEQIIAELVKAYNPYMTPYYHVVSAEENPNSCVIF